LTKPWLEDPQFGGMSERSARLSYEAWAKDGFRKPFSPQAPRPPAPDHEIAQIKASIAIQLDEFEQAIRKAVTWHSQWKARQPKGFRALRRQAGAN
jgi:hypothetical protein